jgi:hypothetical protein
MVVFHSSREREEVADRSARVVLLLILGLVHALILLVRFIENKEFNPKDNFFNVLPVFRSFECAICFGRTRKTEEK